ncbi:MAG: hypothetical protein ABJ221_08130 [Haloferula sp.]
MVWDANPEPNVSGYRVYVSEESGAYPNDPIPVTQPEVEISDLENGVTYYCAVTAHNTIGFESSFSAEIEITYVGGVIISSDARLVLLEAEDGNLTAPMVVQSTPDESWIQDDSSSQTGATEISFESQIDAGYYTWCRVKAPSGGSDSLFVSTDGGDEEVFHIYDNPTPPPSSYSNDWVWRRINDLSGQPIVFDLSTGGHTITFRTREAGVQLDRIILCSDRDFVPNDTLPRSGDVLAITESPVDKTIAPGGGVTFDVVAAATGPIQYQWVKDGLAITGETESSLLISPTEYDDAGHYSVFIWSDTAIKTTGAAELTVFEPPFAVTSMSVASDRSITFNLSGQFGQDVQVFASSELDEWTLISTQTNTIGVISVDDPDAQNQTKRFYKLVTIEP